MSNLITRLKSAAGDGDSIYLSNRCTEAADALEAAHACIAGLVKEIENLKHDLDQYMKSSKYEIERSDELESQIAAVLVKQEGK